MPLSLLALTVTESLNNNCALALRQTGHVDGQSDMHSARLTVRQTNQHTQGSIQPDILVLETDLHNGQINTGDRPRGILAYLYRRQPYTIDRPTLEINQYTQGRRPTDILV